MKVKVYQRLASAFKEEGVTATFGMMGDGNMYWLYALHKLGMKVHECRHEGAALGMADGYARVTQAPAVATATCGPGVTQLATALVTAARARSPIVVFCGESPTTDDDYEQHTDPARFAATCEAGFVRLNSPDNADDVVRKAFYLAKTESRPIILSAPMDFQQKDFEADEPYRPSSSIYTPGALHPNAAVLEQAADIIASSKKTVIIAGRGARWSGAGDAILKLGDRIGALIATSLLTKTYLSENEYHAGISGFYGARSSLKLLEEADCVIGVGATLNRFTIEYGYLYPNARFVQIDSRPHLMLSGSRGADCYVQSDARLAVEALDKLLEKRGVKQVGYRTPDVKATLANQRPDAAEFPIDAGTVDPREACEMIDQMLPPEIGLWSGGGMSSGFTTMHTKRRRTLTSGGHFFGCIGQGLPAAMGAIVATGNKPVALIDGDACFMMHLAEFETAVRYKMPLLVVVLNNEALGAEYYKLDAKQMDPLTSAISTPDLGAVGVSLGGRGHLARSIEELKKAVAEYVAKPGPMIIDLRISRSVISIPYRRMFYGRDD